MTEKLHRVPANDGHALLVVLSGPPGSGKTTLGRYLAERTGLPMFSKDIFKDLLFDALGSSDRDWSIGIGIAAVDVLFEVAAIQLKANRSLILENAFVPKHHTVRFQALRNHFEFDLLQIWCTAPSAILYDRFRARAQSGNRHPGHVDSLVTRDSFEAQLRDREYSPIRLDGRLIEVDTSEPDNASYDQLVEAIAGSVVR